MDLHRAKYLLPNSLTMGSAFAGFTSIYVSLNATDAKGLALAAWLIVIAMFCDLFDGRVARMTKTESALGVQLDSLADALSFGIAPGFLIYSWGLEPFGILGLVPAFVYAACAILRLARFNVMAAENHGVMKYFLGLPTPLAAGAVVSIVLAHLSVTEHMTTGATGSVALMALLLGGLMVSNVKYRTFKDVNFRGRFGVGLIVFVTAAVALGFITDAPSVAFVALMVGYILVGVVGTVVHWSRAILGDDSYYEGYSEEEILEEEA